MPNPIITPRKFLARETLLPEAADCTLAVVGFCRFNDMKSKLLAEPLSETIFSHLDKSHQFLGYVAGHKILAIECLYGGPLSATVLEELAHYGIRTIIGYGYAGSLKRQLPIGQIFVAKSAVVSDGTSREYVPKAKMAYPNASLLQILGDTFKERRIAARNGIVWTTDAIYREYPIKIEKWRESGADIVNMDTSYFYAVSTVVGLSSVYACVISDCVEGPNWDEDFTGAKKTMADLQDAIVATAAKLC